MSEIFNSHIRVSSMDDARLKELMRVRAEMQQWKDELVTKHPETWQQKHISWQLHFDVKATLNGSLGMIEFLSSKSSQI